MSVAVRVALKVLATFAVVLGVAIAVIWPWPTPIVDWRTPLEAALAKNDCARAVEILSAATQAGSVEAYELLAERAAANPCLKDVGVTDPAQEATSLRFIRTTGARLPLPDDMDMLGVWLSGYVSVVDFLCRQPYDTNNRTDEAYLSAALPDSTGWLMALHRQRRATCSVVVEDLAMGLAERDEPQANEVALTFALADPINDSATSGIVLATVLLERQFVPRWLAAGDDHGRPLKNLRQQAWIELERAAEANDPKAIATMISLLNQRRFIDEAPLLESPENEAYFWILRSRRLGLPQPAFYSKLEGALSTTERTRIKAHEQLRWESQKLSAPHRSGS